MNEIQTSPELSMDDLSEIVKDVEREVLPQVHPSPVRRRSRRELTREEVMSIIESWAPVQAKTEDYNAHRDALAARAQLEEILACWICDNKGD